MPKFYVEFDQIERVQVRAEVYGEFHAEIQSKLEQGDYTPINQQTQAREIELYYVSLPNGEYEA